MKARWLSAALAGAVLALSSVPATAQQEWSFEGDQLFVSNMAGEITVRGHDGDRIIVRASTGGEDAALLDFQVEQGGRAEFHVIYPLDRSLNIGYPRRGHGETRFRLESWVDDSPVLERIYSGFSRRDRVEIGRRGDIELWADLEVLVPRGVATRVNLAVGELEASDLETDVLLDTHSGPVRASNIRGNTLIDTGSGSVDARGIRGDLNIDTGSGRVEATDVEGDDILIDTGSGSVTVERARARSLRVDTGSGRVSTSEISAVDTEIDTGSGSVTLDLMELGDGNHAIDTGSGRVTVILPTNASLRILAESGSGGIDLDIPNARLRRMSRNEVELELGDGRGRLEIDTGSGRITIRSR